MPSPKWAPNGLAKYKDESYDGVRSSSTWSDGLGQLADRVIGQEDLSKVNDNAYS